MSGSRLECGGHSNVDLEQLICGKSAAVTSWTDGHSTRDVRVALRNISRRFRDFLSLGVVDPSMTAMWELAGLTNLIGPMSKDLVTAVYLTEIRGLADALRARRKTVRISMN